MEWTEVKDQMLEYLLADSDFCLSEIAQKLGTTTADVKARIYFYAEHEKQAKPLQHILNQFPYLSTDQAKQAAQIWEYSPIASFKYCQVCENYRIKKQNEPTHIRYNRRRKKIS